MKYTGPKYRFVRRVGTNLHGTSKAAKVLGKRKNPPGHRAKGGRRGKLSDYGIQLLEKQKVRYLYNISEKQLKIAFDKAKRKSGDTGENLLAILETRLDNAVFKMGFAPTIYAARQFVSHKHFMVNGRSVNIPSYQLRVGDIIAVRDRSKNMRAIREAIQRNKGAQAVPYFSADADKLEGRLEHWPDQTEITLPIKIAPVIEWYSR